MTKPTIHYAFPHQVNKDLTAIVDNVNSCIDTYTFIPLPVRAALKAASFGKLVAFIYPHAAPELLLPCGRLVLWIFIFDDLYGPLPVSDLIQVHGKLTAILNGDLTYANEHIMLQHFALSHQELSPYITPLWLERYIADWQYFFEGMILDKQYSYQSTIIYPSIEEYMILREKVGGIYPFITLSEIIAGFILPPEIFRHPAIQQARLTVSKLVTWTNDLFSVNKERENNEAMNLVAVIQNEHGCSWEEAYNTAISMHNQVLAAYITLRASWPNFGDFHARVETYISLLEYMISGNLAWYADNPRYQ
ncbi:hypothetical protein ACDQ55_20280 [Chitinophaga sp. 30R24]|uniref:terpene synthase family protein n=1 Tax=Chitinophaga sp. 30R24 TaxID=3248838 RepID=UPI003B8FAAF6